MKKSKSAQKVLSNVDLMSKILAHKYQNIWSPINYHREMVTDRYKYRYVPYSHQDHIHSTDLKEWRETAVVLGLYWLLVQD